MTTDHTPPPGAIIPAEIPVDTGWLWEQHAACRDADTALFYPTSGSGIAPGVRAICAAAMARAKARQTWRIKAGYPDTPDYYQTGQAL